MYRIITQNIDRILDNIDEELDIRIYLSLLNRVHNIDVTQDKDFQNNYCRYWRLYGAGLSQEFRSAYFQLMEKYKDKNPLDIKEITRTLYDIPSNKKGKKTLQFSFASKLIHTLEPHRPIYDNMVATFYRFSVPNHTKSYGLRILCYLNFYDSLIKEYESVLTNGLLSQSIESFKHKFSISDAYTNEKVIDTLIWRSMDLKQKDII